jgi:hypothetical protein
MTNTVSESYNHSKHIYYYRTKDGLQDYRFSFEEQPDQTWRAYILVQPDYGSHSSASFEVHRNQDRDHNYWVDWQPDLVCSKQDAMTIAAFWAESNQIYLKSGIWPCREEVIKSC